MNRDMAIFAFCIIGLFSFGVCLFINYYLKKRTAEEKIQKKLFRYHFKDEDREKTQDKNTFIKKKPLPVELKLSEFLLNHETISRIYKVFIQNKNLHYSIVLPSLVLLIGVFGFLISRIMKIDLIWGFGGGGVASFILFYRILNYFNMRQERKFVSDFPNALDIISRGLKVGIPLEKTINTVLKETSDPVRGTFQYIFDQINFGVSFDQALRNAAKRVQISDFYFFVSVLILQKKTGGSAADLVAGISKVIREKEELRKKITALSAEAKTTGWIVGSLPVIAFIYLSYTQESYIEVFQNDPSGRKLFFLVIGMLVMCVLVIKKMVNFKDL